MKKIICLVICLLLALTAFAACAKAEEVQSEQKTCNCSQCEGCEPEEDEVDSEDEEAYSEEDESEQWGFDYSDAAKLGEAVMDNMKMGKVTGIDGTSVTVELIEMFGGEAPSMNLGDYVGTAAGKTESEDEKDSSEQSENGYFSFDPSELFKSTGEKLTVDLDGVKMMKNFEEVAVSDIAVDDIITMYLDEDGNVSYAFVMSMDMSAFGNMGGFGSGFGGGYPFGEDAQTSAE